MNTNTETWGNIELPGLSDEELFKKDWEKSARMLELSKDPEYKKKHKASMDKLRKDPEYRKKLSNAQKKLNESLEHKEKLSQAQKKLKQNPEYQKNYSEAMKKLQQNEEYKKNQKEASDKFRNDPVFKEKKRKEMTANSLDPEFQKKRIEGHKKALSNPSWIENVRKARLKSRKKIQTPDGIFESRKLAAEFYKIDPSQINSRIKKWPDQYFYIEDSLN
jgi:hypothetical protein